MTKTIASALAIVVALGLGLPATAQDAGTQTGTQTDARTNTGGNSQAGSDSSTDANAGTSTDANSGTTAGTDANAGTQTGVDVEVNITTEQQTEIRTYVTELNVEPVTIDFDLSIGFVVPKTVVLKPLPQKVIAILPQFEGYLFFLLADGRVVIVASETLTVVYIVNA